MRDFNWPTREEWAHRTRTPKMMGVKMKLRTLTAIIGLLMVLVGGSDAKPPPPTGGSAVVVDRTGAQIGPYLSGVQLLIGLESEAVLRRINGLWFPLPVRSTGFWNT